MNSHGRIKIYTDFTEVSRDNVAQLIEDVMGFHEANNSDINYLWNYYRGEQPILKRSKTIRPEICNRIVENRAHEIVSFNTGYLCGEPIQYIGRTAEDWVTRGVAYLNDMMSVIQKHALDKELIEWMMVAGTAYRLVLPGTGYVPFELTTLDPRHTFVVYSARPGSPAMLGATYYTDLDGKKHFYAYSDTEFFEVFEGKVVSSSAHILGQIPIIEYPAGPSRLGSFEVVLPLLDAINNIDSNRLDGIEQFVQAFMKFVNCDIDEEKFKILAELGALKLRSTNDAPADVDMVSNELDQTQTQVVKDDLYQSVLTICGIPNRNDSSSSGGDNGVAVQLRNGWELAESRAKDREVAFRQSERHAISIMLRIAFTDNRLPDEIRMLKPSDVFPMFTRRNYNNIQSKAQVLVQMLSTNKIHPKLAFEYCGMFADPEQAYLASMEYYEVSEKATEGQDETDIQHESV